MKVKIVKEKPDVKGASNHTLGQAKSAKQDEFYTQLDDIEKELKNYKPQLHGKTVFCNCDDPFESNFFKYFALNFNILGLKKLIATSYSKSPITGKQLPLLDIEGLKPEGKDPYAVIISEVPDHRNRGATDITDVEYLLKRKANVAHTLAGDENYAAGDFRSSECVALLKEADVVITNPPFSLFRQFVSQLVEHKKKYLIIGNVNAITYKEIFDLIQKDELWLGKSIHSGDREFRVPDHYPLEAAGTRVDQDGRKYIRVKGVRWFTNMDFESRHEDIPLYKRYSAQDYPKYYNYDAIDVSKTAEIPCDYDGPMGVPITFLDKYNPTQFEILGSSRTLGTPMSQLAEKGSYSPGGPRFYLPEAKGKFRRMYDRLVIKRRT
ncbi:adenine-specific methyltransferase EcoRI family protein [Stenotrophomonas maltophilia]|uniref:adenine-specific methyltransferase EcoRI family protein n=1 Tax=Stenotrophomonas TaxID=40323 RepID=UPI0009BD881C|nr:MULTISPECIES: adenine-specific methyltransferase EcoRI family protein [Stenotrophomonas]MBH1523898.1 adenine-specific methyltransferase EcoRI family protein [Stenotrophomonas maltophilia]MBH1671990.1 adenine-specific methyltransferase EcoRI family protein [Stenotrophomonas maltophilia]MBN5154826.1 adenine-specific methyltransferase EcoRI family protein [Stenotrophomonas maltophilia]MDG9975735.1 adenine-specific methyltransferase EcoRI family protein [Stenotrophomonas sp. GD04032]MDT3556000.